MIPTTASTTAIVVTAGLNATSGNGNSNVKYWGEYYIDRDIQMAPNAVVILARLCYASGNSEPGGAAPSVTTATKRIDNYGAGFLTGKPRAVLAHGHRGPVDRLERFAA